MWLELIVLVLLAVVLSIITIRPLLIKPPTKTDRNVSVNVPTDTDTTVPDTIAAPKELTSPTPTNPVQDTPPQNCIPNTTSTKTSSVSLASLASGLTQQIDAPTYYQVYGNTSAQIRAQLQQCGPKINSSGSTEYAAATNHNLAWQYNTIPSSSGVCATSNVKVGLHINTILPQWQPTSSASSGLASAWQKMISGLVIHENGHVAIIQQYSNQLLRDIQTFTASNCGALTATIQPKIDADVASLNRANTTYDSNTNFGATQGAVLP